MKIKIVTAVLFFSVCLSFYNCNTSTDTKTTTSVDPTGTVAYGGFASQADWGGHLSLIAGCSDCHTPKKMTARGPVNDSANMFAGCISKEALPDAIAQQIAQGVASTKDQTAWVGPWGKSFASNITSDSTGIGFWKEDQFINCLRKGWFMGLANTRPLMPPMPWEGYSKMTDDELKAIFAYLKSTKPIHNIVPQYEPPAVGAK